MAKNGRARAPKRARAKVAKAPKAPKAVDQELKGAKKAAAPDKGPLSGAGHNLTAVRKLIVPFAGRYNNLLDEKASNAASFMADARVLIEDAANELGTKKRLVRMALQENRRLLLQSRKEAEMDRADLDVVDTLNEALGNYASTELGQAAVKAATKPKASPSAKVVPMERAEPEEESKDQRHFEEEAPAAA